MKLLHLTAALLAIPICLAASSSSKGSSSQHHPRAPFSSADMGSMIDSVLPTIAGIMDLEGQLARKLCEHDNKDKPSKCVELMNEYRHKVRGVMDKNGIRQTKLTPRDGAAAPADNNKSTKTELPNDPVQQCVDACVSLLQEQCNKSKEHHDHLDCNKPAQRKQCRANCNAVSSMFSKKVQEDVEGLLKGF